MKKLLLGSILVLLVLYWAFSDSYEETVKKYKCKCLGTKNCRCNSYGNVCFKGYCNCNKSQNYICDCVSRNCSCLKDGMNECYKNVCNCGKMEKNLASYYPKTNYLCPCVKKGCLCIINKYNSCRKGFCSCSNTKMQVMGFSDGGVLEECNCEKGKCVCERKSLHRVIEPYKNVDSLDSYFSSPLYFETKSPLDNDLSEIVEENFTSNIDDVNNLQKCMERCSQDDKCLSVVFDSNKKKCKLSTEFEQANDQYEQVYLKIAKNRFVKINDIQLDVDGNEPPSFVDVKPSSNKKKIVWDNDSANRYRSMESETKSKKVDVTDDVSFGRGGAIPDEKQIQDYPIFTEKDDSIKKKGYMTDQEQKKFTRNMEDLRDQRKKEFPWMERFEGFDSSDGL